MTSATVNMNAQGRVVIPAQLRRELGFTADTQLVSYVEDGRLVLETREHLIERIQSAATGGRRPGRSVVDELIEDRRAAAREEQRRAGA